MSQGTTNPTQYEVVHPYTGQRLAGPFPGEHAAVEWVVGPEAEAFPEAVVRPVGRSDLGLPAPVGVRSPTRA